MNDLDVHDVNQIIRGVLEKVIGPVKLFEPERVAEWIDAIVCQCLGEINELNKPFKYIVTCYINQRDGAGICSYSLCYFDVETDLLTQILWNNDVLCSNVSIYAMALN